MEICREHFKESLKVLEDTSFRECVFNCKIEVENVRVKFENCEFLHSDEEALFLTGSECVLQNCEVTLNGNSDVMLSQIFAEDSKLLIFSSEIKNGVKASGIEAYNSSVYIKGSTFESNELAALMVHDSNVKLDNSTFNRNGLNDQSSSQLIFVRSSADINEIEIRHSRESGIYMFSSSLFLKKVSVLFGRLGGIKMSEKSVLKAFDCSFEDIKSEDEAFGIWIEESQAIMKKCKFCCNDCAVYAQKGSSVELNNCIFNGNTTNLCLFEFSVAKLFPQKNGNLPRLYIDDSSKILYL